MNEEPASIVKYRTFVVAQRHFEQTDAMCSWDKIKPPLFIGPPSFSKRAHSSISQQTEASNLPNWIITI